MFGWLGDLLSSVWHFIRKFWPLILIAIIVFWPELAPIFSSVWGSITSALGSIWSGIAAFAKANGWPATLALGFGALSILDPSAASQVAANLGHGLGALGSAVGGAAVTAASGTLSALLQSPIALVAGGILLFVLLDKQGGSQ